VRGTIAAIGANGRDFAFLGSPAALIVAEN
jgi:hypothetical protein